MHAIRKLPVVVSAVLTVAGLTACGGGGDAEVAPPGTGACSINGQKQFVIDNMRFWYLWNDRLPADVNLDSFATTDALLDFPDGFQS